MFQKQEQCNLERRMKSTPTPGYHCPFGLKINAGFQFDVPKLLPLCDGIHNWEGKIPSHIPCQCYVVTQKSIQTKFILRIFISEFWDLPLKLQYCVELNTH